MRVFSVVHYNTDSINLSIQDALRACAHLYQMRSAGMYLVKICPTRSGSSSTLRLGQFSLLIKGMRDFCGCLTAMKHAQGARPGQKDRWIASALASEQSFQWRLMLPTTINTQSRSDHTVNKAPEAFWRSHAHIVKQWRYCTAAKRHTLCIHECDFWLLRSFKKVTHSCEVFGKSEPPPMHIMCWQVTHTHEVSIKPLTKIHGGGWH
jgi:hypothetical protein